MRSSNNSIESPKRVVLYSRPWTVELNMALEDRWAETGRLGPCEHLTQHVEAVDVLSANGRKVRFLTGEIEEQRVEEPERVLADAQRRLGPSLQPLNRYRLVERYFERMDPGRQLELMAKYVIWFERYFEALGPGVLIANPPDQFTVWLAQDIARHFGTSILSLNPSVVPPDRLCIFDHYAEIPGARDAYAAIARDGLSDDQRQAARRTQDSAPSGSGLSYLHSRGTGERVKRLLGGSFAKEQFQHTRNQLRERRAGNWFVQPTTPQWIPARIRDTIRARAADRRYLSGEKPAEPFAFFPLHVQPEASTLVAGSYFVNQLEVAKNLAQSIPIGWRLAIKEHFWMRGQRPLSYYRELAEIPNAVLLHLDVPTGELIDDSELVATISSNAGLEAALWGKGVLVLGEVPWAHAPTVRSVDSLSRLPAAIADAAAASRDRHDEQVLAFAASWDASLPPGRYYEDPVHRWQDPANIELIASAIEDRVVSPGPRNDRPDSVLLSPYAKPKQHQ